MIDKVYEVLERLAAISTPGEPISVPRSYLTEKTKLHIAEVTIILERFQKEYGIIKDLETLEMRKDKDEEEKSKNLLPYPFGNMGRTVLDKNHTFTLTEKFHNFVPPLDGVSPGNAIKRRKKTQKEFFFDENTSQLFIGNKPIPFTATSKQCEVLKVILSDCQKKWFYTEIGECLDPLYEKEGKDIYDILTAIKNKIAKETGIKDFFTGNTKFVKISDNFIAKEPESIKEE